MILEDVFGAENHRNSLVWRRTTSHNDSSRYGRITDSVQFFSNSQNFNFNYEAGLTPKTEEQIQKAYPIADDALGPLRSENLSGPSASSGESGLPWKGYDPSVYDRHWAPPKDSDYAEYIEKNFIPGYRDIEGVHDRLDALDKAGLIRHPKSGAWPQLKRYAAADRGTPAQNLILEPVGFGVYNQAGGEYIGYPTQKPLALLERFIAISSNPGDLVLDFFAGSGTTLAVAEKMGRRWIGADLGRYAIHTTRKRLLDIPDCRPFEVQNLGRYERKHWQGVNVGEAIGKYYSLILELYQARSVGGFVHLHGEKAGRMVHVGATDAPVTHAELRAAIEECVENGFASLDVLGWEWEMGLNKRERTDRRDRPAGEDELAAHYGVDTHLLTIPREVMDKGVKPEEVHFFELSVAEVEARVDGREATLALTGFLPALDDYMREKTEGKIARWSDWIDYWSVDYEYDGETFVNQWQAYRTRREPRLALVSDPHRYAPGRHTAVVKVIDIFGNDTTCEIAVTVE